MRTGKYVKFCKIEKCLAILLSHVSDLFNMNLSEWKTTLMFITVSEWILISGALE